MKFVDFGFPEDKIPGTFRTNCPGWKAKIKGAKCKISWALRLADEVYPYQLTANIGFLEDKEVFSSRKKNILYPGQIWMECSDREIIVVCFGVWPKHNP